MLDVGSLHPDTPAFLDSMPSNLQVLVEFPELAPIRVGAKLDPNPVRMEKPTMGVFIQRLRSGWSDTVVTYLPAHVPDTVV